MAPPPRRPPAEIGNLPNYSSWFSLRPAPCAVKPSAAPAPLRLQADRGSSVASARFHRPAPNDISRAEHFGGVGGGLIAAVGGGTIAEVSTELRELLIQHV